MCYVHSLIGWNILHGLMQPLLTPTSVLNREVRLIEFRGASERGNRSFLRLSTGHEVGIMHVHGMHGHDFHEAIANVYD